MGEVWFLGLGANPLLPFPPSPPLFPRLRSKSRPFPFPPPLPFPPVLPLLPSRRSRPLKSSQLGGLWEQCKLPRWGLGLRPGRNRIWCILALKCDIWWQRFSVFPENQLTKFRAV